MLESGMSRVSRLARILCVATVVVLASSNCWGQRLVAKKLGSTRNVHAYGTTLLCGQPSTEDLALARQQGIDVILTLRSVGEVNWDQQSMTEQLGMEFHRVPFTSPDTLTNEVFDAAREILRNSKQNKKSVMLHCGSANRVGAIWMAHRVLDDGVDIAQAEQEAEEVGLRTPGYRTRALAYINQTRH